MAVGKTDEPTPDEAQRFGHRGVLRDAAAASGASGVGGPARDGGRGAGGGRAVVSWPGRAPSSGRPAGPALPAVTGRTRVRHRYLAIPGTGDARTLALRRRGRLRIACGSGL